MISGNVIKLIMLAVICFALDASVYAYSHISENHHYSRTMFPRLSHFSLCSPQRQTHAIASSPLIARATITNEQSGGSSGPATIDRPKLKKKESTKNDSKLSSDGWEVRLYNDPYNKREFVARCLVEICGKNDGEAFQVMMQAHNNGKGVIGRYMFERAELYLRSLKEQGLLVDMVPVEDD